MPIYPANSPRPPTLEASYYVLKGGEAEGPYDLPFIEAMVLAGMLHVDVSVSKDGKTGWERLDTIMSSSQRGNSGFGGGSPPPLPSQPFSAPTPKDNRGTRLLLWYAAIIGAVIFVGYFVSQQSTPVQDATYQSPATSQTETSTYQPAAPPVASPSENSMSSQPPASTPASTETAAPAPAAEPAYTPAPSSTPAQPVTMTPIAPQPIYEMRDSSGQNFRVSHSDYDILTQEETRWGRVLTAITQLKASHALQSNLIDSERATLNNTDQYAVTRFNALVDQYNAGGTTLERDINTYNAGVQADHDYLIRVGRPQN